MFTNSFNNSSNVCEFLFLVYLSASKFASHKSFSSSTLAPLVSSFAYIDLDKIPFFPANVVIDIPTNINKIIIVTTNATSVIPLFCFFIYLFPSMIFYIILHVLSVCINTLIKSIL